MQFVQDNEPAELIHIDKSNICYVEKLKNMLLLLFLLLFLLFFLFFFVFVVVVVVVV